MESFLLQASIYLGAAVIVVPLSVRLGLGSVLGYLAAGILMGPIMGLAGAESGDLQEFAEFGVVLMLFLIGLELRPQALWDMRKKLIGMGGLQVTLTLAGIAGAALAFGMTWQVAVILGMLGAMSSTAIVLQTLSEKGLMRTKGGRATFAVLLTQDLAVVPILSVMPFLSQGGGGGAKIAESGVAGPLLSWVHALPAWGIAGLTLGIVAGIVLAGHYFSRSVFGFIHAAKLPEMSTFISLLLVLGIAFLMTLVGLSPALGTFVAGVVLANSEFRHQLEADLQPFKGLLMGLFFMTVGVGINFALLVQQPLLIVALVAGLIVLKATVLFVVALLFRLEGRDTMLFALGLAQGGEFGFLIITIARSENALGVELGQIAQLVISLSMLLTPLLFFGYEAIARQIAARVTEDPDDVIEEGGDVIIAGMGRFGQVVNRLVRHSGLKTVVLDNDMATIETMRRFGVKSYFGDPTRPELMEAAGLMKAQALVVALPDKEKAIQLVRFARARRPDMLIVARARDRIHVYELYQAGATQIVRETFDSSVRAGRYVLEGMGYTDYEAATLSQTFYHLDRSAMRSLAELWVPGERMDLNARFVARAKELDGEMQSSLMQELDKQRAKTGTDG
ncbi:MAG: cation:proton antiporter [Candidatus Saccharibacteria bacterium]|nr:cation:proton antiporter [Pseudorhodobacter sp.]